MNQFSNQLGNWNPQLLREYRGRLKSRSVIAAIVLSAIVQLLLLLSNLQDRPFQELTSQEKWLNLWTGMAWIIPYALFTIGSFYLVSDLTQEEQRGTLNFIRLSPYPAWKILLGKLLGVPALPCLTIALAIPLHVIATIQANLPLSLILSYYVLLFAGCVFCYSFAMLYALAGSVQVGIVNRQLTTAISFVAIVLLVFTPLFMFWNIVLIWKSISSRVFIYYGTGFISWFYIPLIDNVGLAHLFTLASLAIGTALIWSVLLRRFRQPRSTLMSKPQSYLILALLEVFALGFFVEASRGDTYAGSAVLSLTIFSAALILVSTLSICPRRQALIDWSRYQSRSWQSWIWADKSPIAIATLIQILIAAALVFPWLFISKLAIDVPLSAVVAFLTVANILLIYSILIQLIFATKIRNPLNWAIGAVLIGLALPPAVLTLLYLVPERTGGESFLTLWVFFGYPFWNYGDRNQLLFAGLGVVLQWIFLAGLVFRFRRSLRRLTVRNSQPIAAGER